MSSTTNCNLWLKTTADHFKKRVSHEIFPLSNRNYIRHINIWIPIYSLWQSSSIIDRNPYHHLIMWSVLERWRSRGLMTGSLSGGATVPISSSPARHLLPVSVDSGRRQAALSRLACWKCEGVDDGRYRTQTPRSVPEGRANGRVPLQFVLDGGLGPQKRWYQLPFPFLSGHAMSERALRNQTVRPREFTATARTKENETTDNFFSCIPLCPQKIQLFSYCCKLSKTS